MLDELYGIDVREDRKIKLYSTLGRQVREFRKAKNLSQNELAEVTALSQGYISEIEAGNARITVDILVELCRVFQVTPNQLLGEELSNIDKDLLVAITGLDPEEQKKLHELYKVLKTEKR